LKTLVVLYSLSGTSRRVAEAIARDLDADIEEIRCPRYTGGFRGFLRMATDMLLVKLPGIERLVRTPSQYDLVVVGGPIWAGNPATPVGAYLKEQGGRLPRVAFFLTYGGSGAERALRRMEELAGREPEATLVLREADVKAGRLAAASELAARLKTAEPVH
jgi:hypothetical protein